MEEYYEEGLRLNPFSATLNNGDNRFNDQFEINIGASYLASQRAFWTKYNDLLNGMDKSKLTRSQQVSYEILKWECRIGLEGLQFASHLMPLDQLWCVPIIVTQQASGQGAQPFNTVKDYENWLQRIDGFIEWNRLAIERMREGIQKGYTLPDVLTKKMIPMYALQSETAVKDHIYYQPVLNFPSDIREDDSIRLARSYKNMVENKVKPSFRALHTFLTQEYLPKCRGSHGISDIPDGKAYYNYLIKVQTTTELDAEEIHQIGLNEVRRIRSEMTRIKQTVGFKGDLLAFFDHVRNNADLMPYKSPGEVIDNFASIRQRVEARIPELFDLVPTIPLQIKRVEAFREATASAHYNPGAPDGSRPGTFYVPIPDVSKYNTYADESLFLHEAIPGHHFQVSLASENLDIPSFRKFLWYGAYGEGWGLYAESLGKELGLFDDPYQHFGMLSAEMHRAIRLVVDTGIHAKGWTREEAIAYSLDNEALAESIIESEIERYMAWPGQALSYKIGQLKIQELRKLAEEKLGAKFSAKTFHNKVLESGGVPLKILEDKILAWINAEA